MSQVEGVSSAVRMTPLWLLALCVVACPAWSQENANADDVHKGRELAIKICANCHVAARDQPYRPILRPSAPSFAAIAQRKTTNANSIQSFLTTTHRGLDNPKGMPNPELLDHQVKEVTAYLLSLRKKP
jgi:mono/diheme cytochrome c family protein